MPRSVLLWCLIAGGESDASDLFSIRALPGDFIESLSQKIYKKRVDVLKHLAPSSGPTTLRLFAPTIPVSIVSDTTFKRELSQLDLGSRQNLELLPSGLQVSAYDLLREAPASRLHILVQIKPVAPPIQPQAWASDEELHVVHRWRSRYTRNELPTLEELKRLIESPLQDNEKVSLASSSLQGLLTTIHDNKDYCTKEDVDLLFRASETERYSLLACVVTAVFNGSPSMGTEDSFHSFWDDNIRKILELLIPIGKSTRNSSKHTATRKLRPDYAFLVQNLCPFRGEEESPQSLANPKAELANKLSWAYRPAPYIFGYYTLGPYFTLVAIVAPLRQGGRPIVHDLAYADLSLRKDRIRNIRRLINIAGLFKKLAELVHPPDPEFETMIRDHSTIEITSKHIVKTYTGADKRERVEKTRRMYHRIVEKGVPGTDSLVHSFDVSVVLSPRGMCKPPETEKELLEALTCVLETLRVLHRQPPLFHRDIRWPNIVQCLETPHVWILIDWEDATGLPTKAQPHFDRSDHSPGCFSDGHGAEVDLWSVGQLIYRSNALGTSSELREMGEWMQSSATPSAEEALGKVKVYHASRYPLA